MDPTAAVTALAALAHDHRLALYRMLVERGPQGMAAGEIADALSIPPSSLTFHLKQLQYAGLVLPRRASRQVFYSADFDAMNRLMAYLTQNCCGSTDARVPLCCPPALGAESAAE